MTPYGICEKMLREDEDWLDEIVRGALDGEQALLPAFLEALSARIDGMEAQGHWDGLGPDELVAWVKANAARHFRRHPLGEPYGMAPATLVDEGEGRRVVLRAIGTDGCLGGRLAVEPLDGSFPPVVLDRDDACTVLAVSLPSAPAGPRLRCSFHGYDFCWSDGIRPVPSSRVEELARPLS